MAKFKSTGVKIDTYKGYVIFEHKYMSWSVEKEEFFPTKQMCYEYIDRITQAQ